MAGGGLRVALLARLDRLGGADDLDADDHDTLVPDPKLPCRPFAQIQDPSLHVGAAIVDLQRDIFPRSEVGDLNDGSQG